MADFTLTRPDIFAEEVEVEAFLASNWPTPGIPSGEPLGEADDKAKVEEGEATFTGLTQDAAYYAVAEVAEGEWRYVSFVAGADTSQGGGILRTSQLDTDGTLAANSDTKVPSQKAVKTYADASVKTEKERAETAEALKAAKTELTVFVANAQSGSYTLALTDAGKCVEISSAEDKVLTIPTNTAVAFPTGTVIRLSREGAGKFTVAAAEGVTLHSPGGKVALTSQYSAALLRKVATNTWDLTGELA